MDGGDASDGDDRWRFTVFSVAESDALVVLTLGAANVGDIGEDGDDDEDGRVAAGDMRAYAGEEESGGSATDGNLKLADENCDDERASLRACNDLRTKIIYSRNEVSKVWIQP